MKIYILSMVITSLDRDSFTTSSQKYEFDFSQYLSYLTSVSIISMAKESEYCIKQNSLTLYGADNYNNIQQIISQNTQDAILIFWGYDFKTVAKIQRLRHNLRIKCIPFIYDRHNESINDFRFLKRCAADIYFKAGKALLKHFDAYIFFREDAARQLHVKKPYVVTKPGVREVNQAKRQIVKNPEFRIAYFGTISKLNCIDKLLSALERLKGTNIILEIYGYGPFEDKVTEAARTNKAVIFGGKITDSEISNKISNIDLLINLRDTNSSAMNFAFPSKLFEYMNTGVPILTTEILDDKEFRDSTFIIKNISSEEIANQILKIRDNYDIALEKAEKAKKFVRKNYGYKTLVSEIYEFLQNI